jgi:hypothetical protein
LYVNPEVWGIEFPVEQRSSNMLKSYMRCHRGSEDRYG